MQRINTQSESRRPAAMKIPAAWRARPRTSARKVLVRVVLLLVRNAIPVAGYVYLGWSADVVALLGGFNLGMVFSSAATLALALPHLKNAGAAPARLRSMGWSIATVCITWLVIACVAALEPALALYVYRTPGSGFVLHEAAIAWSVLGLSCVSAANYFDDLRERLRAPQPPARADAPRKRAPLAALAVTLLLEGWILWLLWLPLVLDHDGKDLGPQLAVTIVVAVSLFLDALQTLAPGEMPQPSA